MLEKANDEVCKIININRDVIKDDGIPAEARIVLRKQEETLQKTHDYMKIMKDNVKAA